MLASGVIKSRLVQEPKEMGLMMMRENSRKRVSLGVCLLMLSLALVVQAGAPQEKGERPASWAQAVDKPGLPNLHRVSDGLYRGAQPEKKGFAELEKMGVRTVVNLRTTHSDRDDLRGTKLKYERIFFNPFNAEEEEVVRFLEIMAQEKNRPVFVHCKHGADRTGTMVAFYRLVFENWSKADAVREMREGGFGFHKIWRNLLGFIEKSDVVKLRMTVGMEKKSDK